LLATPSCGCSFMLPLHFLGPCSPLWMFPLIAAPCPYSSLIVPIFSKVPLPPLYCCCSPPPPFFLQVVLPTSKSQQAR
jgi:hypothetical protein